MPPPPTSTPAGSRTDTEKPQPSGSGGGELVDNLIDNAITYNHPGGHVAVQTRALRTAAVLEVANSGPLVASAEVAGLWEPFRRANQQRVGSGYGLGLFVVRAVAKAHGGTSSSTLPPMEACASESPFRGADDRNGPTRLRLRAEQRESRTGWATSRWPPPAIPWPGVATRTARTPHTGSGDQGAGVAVRMRRLPELVEGPRLLLRRWTVDDVDILAAAVQRNVDHLRPWMPWIADEPLSRDDRCALVGGWEREWRSGADVMMGIFLDEAVVGGAGLHRRTGPDVLEVGYWVDVDHLGRGIAREAASMLTSAALSMPDVTAVEIHHDEANHRSRRIPECLGYAFVGATTDTRAAPAEVGIDWSWRTTGGTWQPNWQAWHE